MTLYLVRHAHAGSRSAWSGDDDAERPLSDKGRRQADHLADVVGDRPIRRLWSSPAVRCIQTLEPLAAAVGQDVRVAPQLAEGADPDAAVAFLLDHAGHDAAFCSHGDLIPKVLRRLGRSGMRTTDPTIATKGSWWELDVVDGRVTAGRFVPHVAD